MDPEDGYIVCFAVVELISKQRQPLPELNALYFLSPSEDSVRALIEDFKDERKPQYRSAYIYFSCSLCTPLSFWARSFISHSEFSMLNPAQLGAAPHCIHSGSVQLRWCVLADACAVRCRLHQLIPARS